MFTIEIRVSKTGKKYIGLFPDGGKRPCSIGFEVCAPLLGLSYKECSQLLKDHDAFCVKFIETL